ncbi:MAG: PEP-CTERM sorting domain-containing protein [Chthoniobacterales bacterium]
MIPRKSIFGLLSLLCCLALSQARANHVDFMTDGAFIQSGPGSQVATGSAANILGTMRRITITAGSASLTAGGPLNFMAGAGATNLTLGYGTPFGGGAFTANFINPGTNDWNSIVVSLSNVSPAAGGTLSLTVDNAGNQFTFASQPITGAGNYTFFYNQAAGSGVNFLSINGLQANLNNAAASSSYSLAGITRVNSVPEPGTMALAVLGSLFGGFALYRRRRLA